MHQAERDCRTCPGQGWQVWLQSGSDWPPNGTHFGAKPTIPAVAVAPHVRDSFRFGCKVADICIRSDNNFIQIEVYLQAKGQLKVQDYQIAQDDISVNFGSTSKQVQRSDRKQSQVCPI